MDLARFPAAEPDQTGRVSELRREDGADQRTGAGDRGEVMAEQDPAARREVIRAVVLGMSRRGPRFVNHPQPRCDEGYRNGDGGLRISARPCANFFATEEADPSAAVVESLRGCRGSIGVTIR